MSKPEVFAVSLVAILITSGMTVVVAAASPDRPNVLFLAVDDWNDWVGCIGDRQARIPNVDRLAQRGVLFTNAHCAAPICNPSRAALFCGRRPSTTGIYSNGEPIHVNVPDAVNLPRHFRNNGYQTQGGGKVLHEAPGFAFPDDWDYYFLWDEANRQRGWWGAYSVRPSPEPDARPRLKITRRTKRNFDAAALDGPEEDSPDHKVASWAAKFLSQKQNEPFFLAAGIFRPHIPWFNTRRWFDLYPLETIQLPKVLVGDVDDLPSIGRRWAVDTASKHQIVEELGEWDELVQGYLASISFSDAQIGRILDALDTGPNGNNTIIVFWSDHGYHLGEKDHWHKCTLWERSTRVPLIMVAPGVTSAGTVCNQPVSLLDLYPTLVELCGLPKREDNEGRSLVPLLTNPASNWPFPTITTHGRNNHAIRSQHFRYIRYSDGSEELYDHRSDPHEWHNLAGTSGSADVIAEHVRWLPKTNAANALNYKRGEVVFNPQSFDWKRKGEVEGDRDYVNAGSLRVSRPGQY